MSSGARIGLVVATLVVIVLAFVLLSPGGDDEPTTAQTTTGTGATSTGTTEGTATVITPPPPPAPTFKTITVTGGKPAGGVQTITVKKGERVRIAVSSTDTSDEIHLHGYDLKRDLKAGGSVRFSFPADAEGIFEIELEGAGVQIGKLVVEP
jgi:FtsP/CotA-like multicopper oxidase with cupredoxin domain